MSEEQESVPGVTANDVAVKVEESDGKPLIVSKKWKCTECEKSFTQNAGLYNHMKRKHGLAVYTKASISCNEPDCTFKCSMRDKLQAHLVNEHNKPLAFSTLKFSSMKDFEEWKEVFEKQEKCRFVKKSGARIRSNTGEKHTYLYCSRSGTFVSNSKGKRTQMKKGSCKISNYCTASIDCIEVQDGSVIARLCSTHYGHEPSVEYLRLTKSDKFTIADKLAQGVPRDVVIDNVRASVGENIDRIHFLTMKDIRNIERSFGLKNDGKPKCAQGFASVNEWVADMESLGEESPVIFYKAKNSPEVLSDNFKCLAVGDFCLVLMTKGQQEILKKFGQNGVFYLTWLNISNGYDLSLLTLMVADDLNEAFPVAYMICSRITKEIEILFFKVIQERLGSFCARAIMTDDRKSLFDSWCSVMGFVPYYLLSNRFVDADWRDRLITVQNEDVQCAVYEVLYSYLSCTDATKFEENLNAFIKHLKENDDTLIFGLYFEDNYLHRVRLWAGCYDKKSVGVNEHLNLDIVYNELLSVCNNKGKFSKLLDKTLQGLLTIVRDRQHNRITKITKQVQELSHHHDISKNIDLDGIDAVENRKWQIKSESANLTFTVTRKTYECNMKCPLICSECKMCSHMFECSCKVYNFDRTMCKHMHAIGRLFQKNLNVLEDTNLPCASDYNESQTECIHVCENNTSVQEQQPSSEVQNEKTPKDNVINKEKTREARRSKVKVETSPVPEKDDKQSVNKPVQLKIGKGVPVAKKIKNLIQYIDYNTCNINDPLLLKKIFIKLKRVKNVIDMTDSDVNQKKRGRPRKIKVEEDSINEPSPSSSTKRKVGRPRKLNSEDEPKSGPRKLQEILQDDLLQEMSQQEDIAETDNNVDELDVTIGDSSNTDDKEVEEHTSLPRKRGRKPKLKSEDDDKESNNEEEVRELKKIKIQLAETKDDANRRRSKRNIKVKSFDSDYETGKKEAKPKENSVKTPEHNSKTDNEVPVKSNESNSEVSGVTSNGSANDTTESVSESENMDVNCSSES